MMGLMCCVLHRRDMIEKRFRHLRWREKRPPMLPFESYVLLEKLEHVGPESKPALESKPAPEITNITASTAPSTGTSPEATPSAPDNEAADEAKAAQASA